MVTIGSSIAWQARYSSHVRSTKWRNMKQDMIRLRGGRCGAAGINTCWDLYHRSSDRRPALDAGESGLVLSDHWRSSFLVRIGGAARAWKAPVTEQCRRSEACK
jgi:hypothetical protein